MLHRATYIHQNLESLHDSSIAHWGHERLLPARSPGFSRPDVLPPEGGTPSKSRFMESAAPTSGRRLACPGRVAAKPVSALGAGQARCLPYVGGPPSRVSLQPDAGILPGSGLHSPHEARRAQGRNSFSPDHCRISGKVPLPAFTFCVSRFTLFVLPMTIHHEIETVIRSRAPLLYIVTSEETRVQELLLDIAAKRQKKLYEWSCTTGLALAGASVQAAKPRNPATREPLAALDEVIAHVEPAVYLFKDLHPFLGKPGFTVTRRLKEIALHLKHSYKTVVLVSPLLEIPVELEKEITVLNFPLPTREELTALLHQILADVAQFKNVAIDLDPAGRERLLQAALGLTLGEAENVFAKILVKSQRLGVEDVGEVFAEKQQIIRKS